MIDPSFGQKVYHKISTLHLLLLKQIVVMRSFLTVGLLVVFFLSCKDVDDSISPREYDFEIEDFIWEGLNSFYYWQSSISDLADDRFTSQKSYAKFLSQSNGDLEVLFESLLSDKDRFSWVVSDYTALEMQLSRIYKTSGMMIGLAAIGNSDDVIAFVRYVLPGSDASAKHIKRGDIFYAVNNEPLTINNYSELLSSEVESFSIQLAEINGEVIEPTSKSIDLVKSVIQENPIHIYKVLEVNDSKIGYLMYNGFVADFDSQLQTALEEIKAGGIDHFIIDLRYNRGGRVSSSIKLASMITGQFSGEVFAQTKHNDKLSSLNENYLFEANPIQLNMNQLYVISASRTASASELLINGLSSYIDVVLVGDHTTGKNVGSYTIYDWIDNDGNINPRHTWAMQPITLKISNADGYADFEEGLQADYVLEEDLAHMGVLGEIDEPLLEKTLEVMGVLPPKSEKSRSFLQSPKLRELTPLQPAIMDVDLPSKMHKKGQPKNFAHESYSRVLPHNEH